MRKLVCFTLFLILNYCLSIDLNAQRDHVLSNQPVLVQSADNAIGVSASPGPQLIVSYPDPADNLDASSFGWSAGEADGADFTLVLIPDPQNESQYYPAVFTSMTNWIVAQQSARNIVFVTTLGDMVNNAGSIIEYDNADAAMDKLDPAFIPYSVGAGNHDQPTTNFNSYFGITRFSGKSWYGGHYGGTNDNSYSLFNASGMDFILINLDYNPSNAVLDWADALLKSNSDRRAIVESHSILNYDNSWTNQGIYTALKDNPNLFLMLCGHSGSSSDGAAYRSEPGDDGHTIHIMLADYQVFPNGGNGYLRILRFSPATDKIYATTYSPYSGTSITTSPDQMEVVYNMADGTIPPPSSYNVSGGGSYCQCESGLPVGLANSESGVTYTLYKGTVAQTPSVAGNGVAIGFGNQTAGIYTVSGTNGGGTTIMTGNAAIIENHPPGIPLATVIQPTCALATGSVILINLPATGTWTLTRTPGGTITGTGTSTALSGLATGTYTYKVTDESGCTSAASANVVINAQPVSPVRPGAITGGTSVCQGSSQTYSISSVSGATSYTWTLPSGWTGSSTSISITATPSPTSGNVSVTANNSCGSGTARTLSVTVPAIPGQPGTITGNTTVCQSSSNTYSTSSVSGATSYTWTLPSGWTGSSTSISITTTASATGGTISVRANNSCGNSTTRTLSVSVPEALQTPTTSLIQPTCHTATGTITITAPSGSDLTYSIDDSDYSNTSGTFTSVTSGTYNVTVMNPSGCTSSGSSAVINAQPETPVTPIINLNGNSLNSSAANGNQWCNGSGPINGATGQDYTPASGGNYYVYVSNGVCSSEPSNIINFIPTGIEKLEISKTINLYPNPTDGIVTLSFRGENPGNIIIEILNLNGQTMKTEKMEMSENQAEVSLEGLPKGTYFIKITFSGNSVIRTIILQ